MATIDEFVLKNIGLWRRYESADIATNENILLLDEYSKVHCMFKYIWETTWCVVEQALVATSADSVPSSYLVRITIALDEFVLKNIGLWRRYESADIATNENILLLDEYSKVKLF
jgi:hypothetical protein